MKNKTIVISFAPFTIITGLILLCFNLTEQDQLRFILTAVFFVSLAISISGFVRWYKYDRVSQEDTKQD